MDSLFTDDRRRSPDSPLESEPVFEWIDRSSVAGMVVLRETLDSWFSNYPESERHEFRRRFRTRRGTLPAFFELYLHELLLRLGGSVGVHPDLPDGVRKRPDFRVEGSGGVGFYVEAAVASGQTSKESAAAARMDIVFDAFNSVDNTEFFFGLDMRGLPTTPPPSTKMAREIERWLLGLDYDEVSDRISEHGFDAEPTMQLEHDGWTATVSAFPKSERIRGTSGIKSFGTRGYGVREVHDDRALCDVLRRKAKKYRKLDRVMVLAVNALEMRPSRGTVMRALFGTDVYRISFGQEAPPTSRMVGRKTDGLWHSLDRATYGRVGGVLLAESLYPWDAATRDLCLYLNPYCTADGLESLHVLSRAEGRDGKMQWLDGKHPREILELDEDWPGPLHPN